MSEQPAAFPELPPLDIETDMDNSQFSDADSHESYDPYGRVAIALSAASQDIAPGMIFEGRVKIFNVAFALIL